MIESTKTPPASHPEAMGAEASPLDGLPPKSEPRSADGKAWGGAKLNAEAKRVGVKNVSLYYGTFQAVAGVDMNIEPNKVTALIGSSGCGKTTFLRSINRMHELTPGARAEGEITIDGENIYAPGIDPVEVRRLVGMVFQQPNPFPTMSIYENAAAGLNLNSTKMSKSEKDEVVERSLRGAHLWDEVKDRLDKPGSGLSGGQQQRLCIARAIAVEPEVLLMDEPCSALDPVATLAIEDLIQELKKQLHDRDRHPQHAAGQCAPATTPPSSTSSGAASRGAWSRSTRRRRSSPTRPSKPPRTTSAGDSDEPGLATGYQEELEELESRGLGGLDLVVETLTERSRRSSTPTSSSPRW